jgi:hypothetical protein
MGVSVVAFRDISVGEEIFVNYGSTYFEDEPDGCPCSTCSHVNTVPHQDSGIINRQAVDIDARRSANRIKRARQAQNRKKSRRGNDGQSQ